MYQRAVHGSLSFGCCVLMSWAGFWIKLTNAPARVALTLTTYLSVQTLRQAFILSIPKVPYLKLFDVWMIICESMIFASLMEFTLAQVWIDSINLIRMLIKNIFSSWWGDVLIYRRLVQRRKIMLREVYDSVDSTEYWVWKMQSTTTKVGCDLLVTDWQLTVWIKLNL